MNIKISNKQEQVAIIEDYQELPQEIKVADIDSLDQIPDEVKVRDISEYFATEDDKTLDSMEQWEESLINNYDNVKRAYAVGHKAVVEPAKEVVSQSTKRIREIRTELPGAKEQLIQFVTQNKKKLLIALAILLILPLVYAEINTANTHRSMALLYTTFLSIELFAVGLVFTAYMIYRELKVEQQSETALKPKDRFWRLAPYIVFGLVWVFVVTPLFSRLLHFFVS